MVGTDTRPYGLAMQDLQGKTAVVTGAASGIGLAMSKRFAAEGMNVVMADVEEPPLNEAVAALNAEGETAVGVVVDVSDPASVQGLADQAIDRFGRVNVLCNNAGVAGSIEAGSQGISLADWKWVIDVNLWGVIHGHAAFLPHLLEHGDGHIVNTASMAGHLPGHSAYSATKWAVVGITEGLFNQLHTEGSTVGVSCLCPGWVDTRINESGRNRPEWAASPALEEPTEESEMRQAFLAEVLRTGMPPTEVAGLVHDAIVNEKLWIFTDMEMVKALEPRYDAILNNRNPEVLGLATFLNED